MSSGPRPLRLVVLLPVLVLALALPASPVRAGEREGEHGKPLSMEEAKNVLEGLEAGIKALRHLGKHDEAKALVTISEALEQKIRAQLRREEAGGQEREIAKRRLEVMRTAFRALLEGERRDAAHVLEHAIHALELALEGRRDEEARHIRKTAPKVGQQAEVLGLAAELLADWGAKEKAAHVGALARELGKIARRQKAPRPKARGAQSEREVAKRQLEVLRLALPAFREVDQMHLVEAMERAIRAREVGLEGRRDAEAKEIHGRAPSREDVAELCAFASRLYAEWGHEDRAHALKELSQSLLGKREHREKRARKPDRDRSRRRDEEALEHIEDLHRRVRALVEELEELQRSLERR